MKWETEYLATVDDLMKREEVINCMRVGSSIYMNTAKDLDVLVLATDEQSWFELRKFLEQRDDWTPCSDGAYDDSIPGSHWFSVRKGVVNLMVTHSIDFWNGYQKATAVCTALKLADKEHRIIVCRIVRDGYSANQALADAKRCLRKEAEADEEL